MLMSISANNKVRITHVSKVATYSFYQGRANLHTDIERRIRPSVKKSGQTRPHSKQGRLC